MLKVLLLLLLIPIRVGAVDNETFFNDLKITNGNISPEFDKYNNNYTVRINDEVTSLEFDYVLNDLYDTVIIYNNHDLNDNDIVKLRVISEEEIEENYYLKVIKEETKDAINYDELIPLEINEKKYNYMPSLIGIIVFVIWLVLLKLFFL